MSIVRIVLTGGPGSGKTEVIRSLSQRGLCCAEEVSRQVTLEAQKSGISQLFLEDPLLFSLKLLEGRIRQFADVQNIREEFCFFDRGIPDVGAYMAYKNEEIPVEFKEAERKHQYDKIFFFPFWKEIYKSDNERYESPEEAEQIQHFIRRSYELLGYKLIEVPKMSIPDRVEFILNNCGYAVT